MAAWLCLGPVSAAAPQTVGSGQGTISGAVTDRNGAPLDRICVGTWNLTGGQDGPQPWDLTASDGSYEISGIADGTYRVIFESCYGDHNVISQYWNGTADGTNRPDQASAIAISGQTHVTGVNAALRPGATIRGTVTDTRGNPLGGICATASMIGAGGYTKSEANGDYEITRLQPGTYRVDFAACGTGDYLYTRIDHGVEVAAGGATSGVDVAMKRASSISGRVTDSSGAPIAGVCIQAFSTSESLPPSGTVPPAGTIDTDAEGRYSIRPLSAGSYRIDFRGPCSPSTAETDLLSISRSVEVGDEEQLTEIDVTMRPGGRISGTVTNFFGQPMAGVCVGVFGTEGMGKAWGSATTNVAGEYRTRPIQDGTYVVRFDSCRPPYEPQPFVPQYYREAASAETAERLVIAAGGLTEINARLVEGADPCIVPAVDGKRLSRARAIIGASDCRLGRVERVPKRKRIGRVLGQRPDPDTVRPRDAEIVLKVRARN